MLGRVLPDVRRLQLSRPPATLPQQPDTINCGLFVILYIIYHCFIAPEITVPPPCTFRTGHDDLYRYRLFLLRWILNSQVRVCRGREESQ